jgi:hypothetical protein
VGVLKSVFLRVIVEMGCYGAFGIRLTEAGGMVDGGVLWITSILWLLAR